MPHTIGTNVQLFWWSVCGNSFCSRCFPTVIGHVKVDTAVKYIPVIQNDHFYCSFGTSLARTRILVCKLYKHSLFDREIKYLDFVGGHLASAETEWPKHIQVTKKIQVASTKQLHNAFVTCVGRKDMWEFLPPRNVSRPKNQSHLLYVRPQFTTPKLGTNSPRLLVCWPTFFMVARTSLMSELVLATIKNVIASLDVGPEFAPN